MTVFLTTHYIEEAANSDYVVVMKKGEIVGKGTPHQLKNEYASDNLLLTPNEHVVMRRILAEEKLDYIEEKSVFRLPLKDTKSAIPILDETCRRRFLHLKLESLVWMMSSLPSMERVLKNNDRIY